MTINYTTLLGLAKPVTGTESGTWGDVVNDQITSLVEDAIANAASLNVTSGNVTLTDNNGSSDQARMAILLVTGTPGVSRNIVAPSTSKWYIVKNESNAEVVLKGSATTGVTIPAGVEALAFWNGSDFELVSMVGPSSSTDNAITRYDGTTGKVVQNSGVTIDDSNNMTGVVALTTTGVVTVPAGTNSAPAITTTGDTNTGIYFPAADKVSITTGGTERVQVDASGNVGIGVTPSAWASGAKAMQLGAYSSVANSANGNTELAFNSFQNASGANYKYINTDTAAMYRISSQHAWFTAPSGTAGNAITFTQAMTLTASGNLGIGATSPSGKLDVEGSGGTFRVGSAGDSISFTKGGTNYIGTSTAGGQLLFQTGASSDRMIIDSSGLVGIGTTSPGDKLTVAAGRIRLDQDYQIVWQNAGTNRARIYGDASSNLIFETNSGNTERARITSGGNFLVGKTDTPDTIVGGLIGATGYISSVRSSSSNTDTTLVAYSTGASAYRFYVGMGGTVYATSTTISAISDQRLKENIQDLDVGLDKIMALKPRKFDWKPGKGKDKKGDRGWIAQEFEQVFPEMIDTWRDPAPEGEEPYKAVNADLIPILVKAIQELKTELDSVKAELAALKGA